MTTRTTRGGAKRALAAEAVTAKRARSTNAAAAEAVTSPAKRARSTNAAAAPAAPVGSPQPQLQPQRQSGRKRPAANNATKPARKTRKGTGNNGAGNNKNNANKKNNNAAAKAAANAAAKAARNAAAKAAANAAAKAARNAAAKAAANAAAKAARINKSVAPSPSHNARAHRGGSNAIASSSAQAQQLLGSMEVPKPTRAEIEFATQYTNPQLVQATREGQVAVTIPPNQTGKNGWVKTCFRALSSVKLRNAAVTGMCVWATVQLAQMMFFNGAGIAAAVVQIIHEGMEHLPVATQNQIIRLYLLLKENGYYQMAENAVLRKMCELFPSSCVGPTGGTGYLGSLTRLE